MLLLRDTLLVYWGKCLDHVLELCSKFFTRNKISRCLNITWLVDARVFNGLPLIGREKPWERGYVQGRKVWKVVHWRFISTRDLLGEIKDFLSARFMHQWKFMNSRSWSENTISANRRNNSLYLFGCFEPADTELIWVMSLVKTWWCENMNKLFQREVFIDSMRIEGAELKFCLCS